MKQTVRYQVLSLNSKMRLELRITIDDTRSPEYISRNNGDMSTGVTFYPVVGLNIVRPSEVDENGSRNRAPWNPNDSLSMTRYTMPLFTNELSAMYKDLKIQELYTYQGKRLELNEKIASDIRKVFNIGKTVVELSAVVIVQPDPATGDDTRLEGIKIKFNNEQSTVLLTVSEIESLVFNLNHLDIDSTALLLYLNYMSSPMKPKTFDAGTLSNTVDIEPKKI